MKYSIVIPTYNHCDDLLKPCIESIFKYTDLSETEIVVVANGCTDNTIEYLESIKDKVRYISHKDALGYPKAVNVGIKNAKGQYIVLLNNDIVLMDQPKNQWIDFLVQPFSNPKVGITGPVKFDWDCAGIRYDCMAFWLVMIKREVFETIGLLDEIFSPGMGEDGDFCIRLMQAGYEQVSVPQDIKGSFETGIVNMAFPIYHVGNGTFGDNHKHKEEVIERNNQILYQRYGKKLDVSIIIPTYNHFEDALKPCIEAVLNYTDLTNKEVIVVANGSGENTRQFLESLKDKIKYIWLDKPSGYIIPVNEGIKAAKGKYIVTLDDDSFLMAQGVDDWINILKKPFLADGRVGATSPFAHEYENMGFVLHSGCTMYRADLLRQIGMFDEIYNPGYFSDSDVAMKIWKAGYKCLEVPERIDNKLYNNNVFQINFPVMHLGDVQTMDKSKDNAIVAKNREILYSRYGKKNMKYSIVIPTYNHCDDLLKPCIESILNYTDLELIEFVVSANGCKDNTREYLDELKQRIGDRLKVVWSDEALGYTKATNLGIKEATGEFVVLLNNDTELLPQARNQWLDMMVNCFNDPKVGMSGPLILHDDYSDLDVIIFFCAMIRRSIFDEVGLLDEIYSPGAGEDIDFTARLYEAGYTIAQPSSTTFSYEESTNVGSVPIWHKDNRTFKDIPEYGKVIVKRNGLLNCKRYNKNIKLNVGGGGVNFPGFLSVDLHDKRAHIIMDITKLDFDDGTVQEILASHVFEHLNPYHAVDILKEWLRVLKPGGKLAMEMPNLEELCKKFINADMGERYGITNVIYGSVNTTDVGGPDNITSPHLFGWWPQSITDHLLNAGFTNIQIMDEQIPHPSANFRVEAYKPGNAVILPTSTLFDHQDLKNQEPATYIEIFEQNTYQVKKEEIEGKTVIDIGANLGMFALYCAELGAKQVYTIEAQPVIYNLGLLHNVSKFSNIKALNYAVYDEDDKEVRILNEHVGSKVGGEIGELTKTITLETFLERENIQGDDLVLKMDCEGSEFNILYSTSKKTLRRFGVIYFEVHGDTNTNPLFKDTEVVRNYLRVMGFEQVHKIGQYYFEDGKEPVPMDVFVEKWVRV